MSDDNYLYIEPSHLSAQASKFYDAHDRMSGIVNTLRDKLNDLGDFWKEDDTGTQFADKYVGSRDKDFKAQDSTVSLLKNIGDACVTNAKNYDQANNIS